MALPRFYITPDEASVAGQRDIVLNEDTSRHVVQVLRMKPGEQLQLTDGRGNLLTASILDDHKKKCLVKVESVIFQPGREKKVTLAMSLLKNANRFEWFLEKATEIGISTIIPLLCERTEKQHFRQDRMESILVSAMLQSQQVWLPALSTPTAFIQQIGQPGYDRKFIAHCLEEQRVSLARIARQPEPVRDQGPGEGNSSPASPVSSLILIGPEGDFSKKEIESALQQGYEPVTLGETRLRTETAGVVAATLLCVG